VEPKLFRPIISEQNIFAFLSMRKGKLDAVTVSGGEPAIQKIYCLLFRESRNGFAVKLDTNGSQPQVISSLLNDKSA